MNNHASAPCILDTHPLNRRGAIKILMESASFGSDVDAWQCVDIPRFLDSRSFLVRS